MALSDNSFATMQEEAVRRVREMQKKSRSMLEPPNETPPQESPNEQHHSAPKSPNNQAGNILGINLQGIKIDEEKALIALLIYILYKQGADTKLLLALAYLLL